MILFVNNPFFNLSFIWVKGLMPAIYDRHEQLENYMSEWYSKETYLKSYNFMMSTLNGEKFWPETTEPTTKPPPFKKMPGRPKVNRKKEEHEIGSNGRLIKGEEK